MNSSSCILLGGIICCSGYVSFATEPANLADDALDITPRIETLRQTLVANPADRAVRRELSALLNHRRERTLRSLLFLSEGLQAYIAGGSHAARGWLSPIKQSPEAWATIQAFSGVSVEQVFKADGELAEESLCPRCGGTGRQNCRRCTGTGARTCRKCGGWGKASKDVSIDPNAPCSECDAFGVVACDACRGYGVVRCDTCAGTGLTGSDSGPKVDPKTHAMLQETSAMARHLANGGLDLYSANALKCSPKLLCPPIDTAAETRGGTHGPP